MFSELLLKLFRKYIPGHKSYSQHILYEALFNKKYNAHVAIDDAIALATLCRHVERSSVVQAPLIKQRTRRFAVSEGSDNKLSGSITKKPMNLVFSRGITRNAKNSKTQMAKKSNKVGKLGLQVCKMGLHSVQRLKGIGPKTAGALAAVQITKIDHLVKKYNQSGDKWLKNILPYGARFNVIKESILNPSSFSR